MRIFAVFDKVSKNFVSLHLANTDESFVRSSINGLLMDYPLNDIEYYCVGFFDLDSGLIKAITPRKGSWDKYNFPETMASRDKFLTLEQLEEFAKNKKHEFIDSITHDIEDLRQAVKVAESEICRLNGKTKLEKADKNRIKDLRAYIKTCESEIDRKSKLKE